MTEVEFERVLIDIKDRLHEAEHWREVNALEEYIERLIEKLD